MAELGDYSDEGHREVGRAVAELAIDEVVAIGPRATAYGGRHVDAVDEAIALLEEIVRPGDCVLVKGARAMGLERVAEALTRRDRVAVVDVLIAGIVAMVVSIVAGPRFISFLRLREYGQPIREEGPARHVEKQGTPTMGGLLILFSAVGPVPDPEQLLDARAHRRSSARSAAARSVSSTTSSRSRTSARWA